MRTIRNALVVLLVLALGVSAQATTITTSESQSAYTVLTNDLVTLGVTLVAFDSTGTWNQDGTAGPGCGFNGVFGDVGGYLSSGTGQTFAGLEGNTITYTLDTASNTSGYDISQIDTYTGWDSVRANQAYDVYLRKVGGSLTLLTAVNFTQSLTEGLNNTKVSIVPTASAATGIDQVEFVFHNGANGLWNGYRELDVSGAPTSTPEPSTLFLLASGLLGLLAYAWRKRR